MATIEQILLSIIIGTLAAVVYTLRIVVQMDRKLDMIIKHMHVR